MFVEMRSIIMEKHMKECAKVFLRDQKKLFDDSHAVSITYAYFTDLSISISL